jgi:MFS family permease
MIEPIEKRTMYRYLRLESFSQEELEAVFDRIIMLHQETVVEPPTIPTLEQDLAGEAPPISKENSSLLQKLPVPPILTQESMRTFLLQRYDEIEADQVEQQRLRRVANINAPPVVVLEHTPAIIQQRKDFAAQQAHQVLAFFSDDDETTHQPVTKEHFCDTITKLATAVDYRKTMPVTISMLLVGTSVGIISPVMPFIVEDMGLTAGQYGLVVSAFAAAKIGANVPSAVLVERHGRKPYMVHSLSLIALGTGGIGFATSFEQLYVCRLLVGLGVAALSSASTMSIADMSNPKNRAQTMAPIMSAFAAGTALGPAMGGLLADEVGIHPTFYVVGASFLAMTAVNQMLLSETKPKALHFPWQPTDAANAAGNVSMYQATKDAMAQWGPLLSQTSIRNVVVINGFYWVALSGAQMTLLPLLLTNPDGLAMTATGVGQVYMGMSLVQVLGNPVVAKFVDGVGKVPAMIVGCTLISAGMATLPMAHDLGSVALTLAVWSTGSTLLSTAPVAYISDVTEDDKRAQAIALLRTSGDVGFLVGASSVGALADWTGNLDVAMQSSAGLLLTATAWFGMRKYTSYMEGKVKNN